MLNVCGSGIFSWDAEKWAKCMHRPSNWGPMMHACPLPESTLNPTPTLEIYKTTDCISTFDYIQTIHKYGVYKVMKREEKRREEKRREEKRREEKRREEKRREEKRREEKRREEKRREEKRREEKRREEKRREEKTGA